MKSWHHRLSVLTVVCALVGAASVLHLGAQGWARQVPTQPAWLDGLYYRPLTVFSRGGRVTAATGVTSDPQVYYMGSAGGVFKSTDAGAVWQPITDGQIGVGTIGAIDVSESNPSVIYVGTGSACPRGNVSLGDGVYKSTDAGKTWTHIGLPQAGLIGRIRVHPQNPDIAYVAVLGNIFGPNKERGVYRTKDGGKSWDQVLSVSDRTGAVDLTIDFKNPNILLAAMWTTQRQPWSIDSGSTEGGLFRTTDGGDHWTKVTKGVPTNVMVGRIAVSISRADSKRVYAQVEAGEDQGGVFRSEDEGESWTRVNSQRILQQRAFYYTHIFADPVDVDTVYALNTSAYKSIDGGKTFGASGINLHGDNHDLWINPNNNKTMIAANDGGVGVTLNGGGVWSSQDNQMTQELYRIDVDTRWPFWVYAAQQDNTSIAVPSNNIGTPFVAGGGESGYIAVDPRNANIIYAGNYGGTLQRQDRYSGMSENARVYADSETGQRALDMKYRFQWNAPIKLSPHNPDIVYTTSQYVHRSKDGGQTWETISPDLTRNDKKKQDFSGGEGITRDSTGVEVYSTIFAFEESPATPGLLWAGSDDGLVQISRDNGKSWQNITPPGLPEFSTVNVIDLNAKQPGRAIVTAYRYELNDLTPWAFLTNDYGKTWKRIADGKNGIPADHFLRVVRQNPDQPSLLFGGTEYGMYISYDEGGTWHPFQLNLPAVPIMDLKIFRRNLIVATEGRGFWILDHLPIVESIKPGTDLGAATLFKPVDGFRGGGGRGGGGGVPPPTFWYWFRDEPTAPVTVQVMDSAGAVVYTATGQPGTGAPPQRPQAFAVPEPPPGGGGRGAGGGAPAIDPTGGGGGGRGRGGFGFNAGPNVSAHKGLNSATWNAQLPSPFTIPARIVMWGGGAGPMPAAPGLYTVKVSSGTWSQTQTFRLNPDPRLVPPMTDAEGLAQQKMAQEVGGWAKQLYDRLAQIRDAKQQAAQIAEKTPALANAARTFKDNAEKVEGDMTQLRGEANQDALNFPGRMDNQIVVLYGNIVGSERKLPSAVTERYKDLKPQFDQLMQRAAAVTTTEVATFNAAATQAGVAGITIK